MPHQRCTFKSRWNAAEAVRRPALKRPKGVQFPPHPLGLFLSKAPHRFPVDLDPAMRQWDQPCAFNCCIVFCSFTLSIFAIVPSGMPENERSTQFY
jgi:hypothetical protein